MEALINGSSYPGLVINHCTHCKAKQNHSNPVQPVPVQRGPIPPCTIPSTQGTCLVWSFAICMYKCTILYVYCVQGCTRSPTTQLVYRVVLGLGSGVGIILHEQYVKHQPGTVVHSAPCLSWFSSHSACL